MRTIAIMNNKGGVGKTVTAINLADILSREHHKRVILVDCDGQMNLTRFFLPEYDADDWGNVAGLLTGNHEPVWSDNLTPIAENLDLIPGSADLYELDLRAIKDAVGNNFALYEYCAAVREDAEVDFIIFDCPPGFTAASVAALLASDEVVIPMTLDGFSFSGMDALYGQIANLHQVKQDLKIAGVLITQWHNSEVVRKGEELARSLRVPVFKQTIRRTEKVPESTFDGKPIIAYSPKSAASRDYRAWVKELLED